MRKIVTLTAAGLMASTLAAGAATVQNGSFEIDPGVKSQGVGNHGKGSTFADMPTSGNSWGIWQDAYPGWDTDDVNGIEIQTKRTLGLTPYEGDYYAELDSRNNSSIMQDLMLSAGKYILSFAYAPRTNDANTNGIKFGVEGVFEDVITGPTADILKKQWTLVTTEFTVAQAGSYSLFFKADGHSNSYGGLIDDIALTPAPVPLPAAGLLLLGGLGGLAAMRRKRKS